MRILHPVAVATTVALLVGSGSAVAASKITSRQIKDGTITARDIKNRSITPNKLSRLPKGPQGPAGAQGPQGPPGPNIVSRMTRVEASAIVAAGDVSSVTATCPPGMGIVTGGFASASADGEVFYSDTFGSTNTWSVGLDNFDSLVEGDVTAVAFCSPSGAAVASRVKISPRRAERAALTARRRAHGLT